MTTTDAGGGGTALLPPVPTAQRPPTPPPPPGPAPGASGASGREDVAPRPPRLWGWLSGAALLVLSAALVLFLADLTLIGSLRHYRDQRTAYDTLRAQLADGTAPVGQTDDAGALLAPGTPLAILQIPQIGLREVVVEGTSSGVLVSGPGHRRDTPLPGQGGVSVVMGRQAAFGGPFGRLQDLVPGNQFTVVTGQATSTYKVTELRRGGDPLPPAPAPGKGRLTLITADGPEWVPTGVLRVDADLVGTAQPSPARALPLGLVTEAEQPMAGDRTALFPLVLWGEALLAAALTVTWLRRRWGRWQAWAVAVPALALLGLLVADQVARLLPNLL